MEEEQRQQRSLLVTTERDALAVADHLEWTQQPKLHTVFPGCTADATGFAQRSGNAASATTREHESRLARGGFRIAGAGFEPATFGL